MCKKYSFGVYTSQCIIWKITKCNTTRMDLFFISFILVVDYLIRNLVNTASLLLQNIVICMLFPCLTLLLANFFSYGDQRSSHFTNSFQRCSFILYFCKAYVIACNLSCLQAPLSYTLPTTVNI